MMLSSFKRVVDEICHHNKTPSRNLCRHAGVNNLALYRIGSMNVGLPSKKRYVHIKMCDSFLLIFNFLLICLCHSHGLQKNYIYSQYFCNRPNKEDFKIHPVNVLPILSYSGYFKYDHGKRDKC